MDRFSRNCQKESPDGEKSFKQPSAFRHQLSDFYRNYKN